jgi:YVTN family beta-propeller protein
MTRPLPLALALLAALPAVSGGWNVLRTFKVGGDGRWDYVAVDPQANRLYVPRSTRVMVLDLDGHVKGEIPGTAGVHGVAFCRELDRGWTSNGQAGTVTVFKLSTLAVEKVVPVTGQNPDAILYDPATRQVFTFNGRSHNVTVLDAQTSTVKGTIPVPGKPEFAVTDGHGTVFCNDEDHGAILVFDAAARKLKATWPIAPVESPSGLAYDAKDHLLISGGGNARAAVVDATTGKVVATVKTGRGTDAVGFDPGLGCAFVSNGEGTITRIPCEGSDRFTPTTILTQRGARTLTVDPQPHRLYLPTADFEPAKEGHWPAPVPGSFRILEVGEAH